MFILLKLAILFAFFIPSEQKFDKLSIEVLSLPEVCQTKTKKGDMITVHYKGMLTDGAVFDASYNRNSPFDFKVGVGQVIQGWDRGLIGMCHGEKRKLNIPSELGYGHRGAGSSIPRKHH
ncbi:hypothetical protein HZS_667, partial [Henneguya salminicola]